MDLTSIIEALVNFVGGGLGIILGLIVLYAAVRLGTAAYHRSKEEHQRRSRKGAANGGQG